MHISDFDFTLPEALIASSPAEPRDASRMLVLDRVTGNLVDSSFRGLPDYLRPDDVLVLNDTRVIRARTEAQLERKSGSHRGIEVFFAEPVGANTWKVLCKPGRRIRTGDRARFGNGEHVGVFLEDLGAGLYVLELDSADRVLEQYGEIPLPPYLNRKPAPADETSYQTVFAAHSGAVAAPTAGLHFTEDVLRAVRNRGIRIATVTLHVGIGTFLPVRTENPLEHVLVPERYEIGAEAASLLGDAASARGRIVAVGTTSVRALEYLMLRDGEIRAGSGRTDLYILPGFRFRLVSGLLTNFHLPKSTLLMLVSAFADRNKVLAAYQHAVREGYRFYSYGDCMFVVS